MSNTLSQIYLHIVFSTKDRLNLIKGNIKTGLYKYIFGIINKKQKLLCINGTHNHVPLLRSGVGEGGRFPMVKTIGYTYHALSGRFVIIENKK